MLSVYSGSAVYLKTDAALRSQRSCDDSNKTVLTFCLEVEVEVQRDSFKFHQKLLQARWSALSLIPAVVRGMTSPFADTQWGSCWNVTRASVFIARDFYRAMHFSAKRGLAIVCRPSVRLSVCLSVCDVGGL